MIFVTVGTQLPFDRLVMAVDAWARTRKRRDVIAQTGASSYIPRSLEAKPFVASQDFRRLVQDCQLLVAHAGMGSILTALDLGKPVLVMPRRAALGEHRNDHQLATVAGLAHISQVCVADHADAIAPAMDRLLAQEHREGGCRPGIASSELIQTVRGFLLGDKESEMYA